jgi:hypothetical protein
MKLIPLNQLGFNNYKFTKDSFKEIPETVPLYLGGFYDEKGETQIGDVKNLKLTNDFLTGDVYYFNKADENLFKEIKPLYNAIGEVDNSVIKNFEFDFFSIRKGSVSNFDF